MSDKVVNYVVAYKHNIYQAIDMTGTFRMFKHGDDLNQVKLFQNGNCAGDYGGIRITATKWLHVNKLYRNKIGKSSADFRCLCEMDISGMLLHRLAHQDIHFFGDLTRVTAKDLMAIGVSPAHVEKIKQELECFGLFLKTSGAKRESFTFG